MPLLVDGHNLIGQIDEIDITSEDDEAQLVMLLRRYVARKRGRRIVVVFDNGAYGHPESLNGYGVECYFAKTPKDADRELIRRIKTIRRRDIWQVITSDRAVAGEARTRGIKVVSSAAFAQKLKQRDIPALPEVDTEDKIKNRKLSSHEVDEWLRLFGESPESEEDEPY